MQKIIDNYFRLFKNQVHFESVCEDVDDENKGDQCIKDQFYSNAFWIANAKQM
jgi:hypothetical protein